MILQMNGVLRLVLIVRIHNLIYMIRRGNANLGFRNVTISHYQLPPPL
jgi:hypothetical protein